MELHDIPITSLIPQRPPFVMVDRVLSCDIVTAVTELTVRPDNIFLDDGLLSAAGIIENMAQSCAARMGCVNRMNGEAIKIGFIGDIRDCQILRQPRREEVMTTHVDIIEDYTVSSFDVVQQLPGRGEGGSEGLGTKVISQLLS